MLRASARGLRVGRRRDLMASLLFFSSSASAPPLKPSPPSTSPPPPSDPGSARASRFRLLLARAAARRPSEPSPPPPAAEEKKSLAVRTAELFLGMTALFVRAGRGTAPVEEVEEREGVIWEQRPEDVEAERQRQRQRREVTTASPGFSFSAAGLLFPYHIGAAQYLLEKGYITERTPLAGSSAGAIICAVIASGNTMQEALQVTKILAENCRSNGTAFRLEEEIEPQPEDKCRWSSRRSYETKVD